MRRIASMIVFLAALTVPAFAQKAEIEAANTRWIDFFNRGDFAGVASLYTEDATAFPPGSAMVKGRARDRSPVEEHGGASQRSEAHDP